MAKKITPFNLHKAGHDPRAAALSALAAVIDRQLDAQAALETVLQSQELVPSNKRLCTELFYGSLRYFIRLEWFLRRFLPAADKLPKEMRYCLILSCYSMAFLRIPHHATVYWAVSHCKNRFSITLGKVCNGVLRSIQRNLPSFFNRDFYQAELKEFLPGFAVWYSLPFWIAQLWNDDYGIKISEYLGTASLCQAPSGLRLNCARPEWKKSREILLHNEDIPVSIISIDLTPAAVPPNNEAPCCQNSFQTTSKMESTVWTVGERGLAFSQSLPFAAKRMIQEGCVSLQSLASYQALEALEPRTWPMPLWDACAGRGGKTLALSEAGIVPSLVSDPSAKRLNALQDAVRRLFPEKQTPIPCAPFTAETMAKLLSSDEPHQGIPLLSSQQTDYTGPKRFASILLDVPCSGLGTISRHPEICLRRSPDDLQVLTQKQRTILDATAKLLLPNGLLLYISCTLNPNENEQQIRFFLQRHPEFSLEIEYHTPWYSPLNEFFYAARLRNCCNS